MKHKMILTGILALILIYTGCAGGPQSSYMDAARLGAKARIIAVSPFINLSTYPEAGLIAAKLAEAELRKTRFGQVVGLSRVIAAAGLNQLQLEEMKELEPVIQAAGKLGANTVLKGTVTEYRYAPGTYDRPSVGLLMELYDIKSKKVLWSASIARSGDKFRLFDLTLSELTAQLCDEALSELAGL